ncbi:MAG: 23S rRNA (pseudouridine(1915)-N(3))-methyltransferase RlmH [Gemmatimonadota bacterium]|nr:23S rRNA (pseudouridine(1915)-N(3))-methyltransferase RlmH [Gemmatimonadota bacterium]
MLAVGRLRPIFRAAADEYLRRLGRYHSTAEVEVREAGNATSAAVALKLEGERLGDRIAHGMRVVALDRSAPAWSSEQVARRIEQWQLGARPVVVVLGGSHGLASTLLADAAERWGLGPMTLPHELARVVVLEQLYRGCTILRGEPYHK